MNTIRHLDELAHYWKPEKDRGEVWRLYEMLCVKGMSRDEASEVFKGEKKTPSHFRNTFKTLFERLKGGMVSSDFSHFTPVQRSHFNVLKNHMAAEIMILTGNKKDGIALATNTLPVATANGQIDIALSLSRRLHHYYSIIDPSTKRRSFYEGKILYFEKVLANEVKIEKLLNDLNYCVQKGGDISRIAAALKGFELGQFWRYNLTLFTARVLVAIYKNDGQTVLDTTNEAIEFFNQEKTDMPYVVRWTFYFHQITVYIALGDFGMAEMVIRQCMVLPSPGDFNWNLTVYMSAVVSFYNGKPKLALRAYKLAVNTNQKADMKTVDERWYVVKAYLSLYEKLGLVKLGEKFRLYKFLNSVEDASQDKPGQNVALIVVHLLHLLADIQEAKANGKTEILRRKKKAYMKKADTLEGYISSHLTPQRYVRSRIILRMFKQIEHASYNLERTMPRVKKYMNQLGYNKSFVNIDTEAELQPFEKSWEIALRFLKQH